VAIEDSAPRPPGVLTEPASTVPVVHTDLRKGSVGLAGVLMQSVAQISPTLGIFYTIAFNTAQAGKVAPLTYLAAFIVCLIIAVPMTRLARHLPSAGGFYTYVAQGIGPRWGFITGWLYAIMVTIVPAALAAFTGAVLHDELSAKYGFGAPWWAYALVILAICLACAYRGIVISVRFLITMSLFEICVGLGLALTGVFNPGPGGVNADGFNPAHIGNSSGFFLAIVLSIFAFTGFESAAAVGEESRNPKRLVPIAISGSLILIGAFYVFCAWGLQIGWGTDRLTALASWSSLPWLWTIRQPVLIVCGDDDPITPPINHQIMATLLPHARLELVRGGGHLMLLDSPDRVAPLVTRFLGGQRQGSGPAVRWGRAAAA